MTYGARPSIHRLIARAVAAVALLWTASFPALAIAKTAATPLQPSVQRAIDGIQSDSSYQLELPAPPEPTPPPSRSNWLSSFFEWLAGPGQWFVNAIVIILIAAVALFILYLTVPAVREFVERWRARLSSKTPDEPAQPVWSPDAAVAQDLLAQADALARDGQFAAAAHLLLNHSVAEIERRRPTLLQPALTARAIARLDDLPGAARDAFARMADAVERSLWARRHLVQGDWTDARTAYEQFAFGDHWRRA